MSLQIPPFSNERHQISNVQRGVDFCVIQYRKTLFFLFPFPSQLLFSFLLLPLLSYVSFNISLCSLSHKLSILILFFLVQFFFPATLILSFWFHCSFNAFLFISLFLSIFLFICLFFFILLLNAFSLYLFLSIASSPHFF